MSAKVNYIKGIYRLKEYQNDLTLDSIVLFCNNMSGNHIKFEQRAFSKAEIDKHVNFFRKSLFAVNDIEEYNQTS